jgi:predicted RND superfamily exporter protein
MTVVIVGFSYVGCMGAGGYLGLPNNQLNGNIPFLLLGLGVDDAFVLTSEYMRAALGKMKNIFFQSFEKSIYHCVHLY